MTEAGADPAQLRTLRLAAVAAAREARSLLANRLEPAARGSHDGQLSAIVGELFAAEVDDPRRTFDALCRAVEGLQTLLRETSPTSPVRAAASRALALIYAARRELGRAHGEPRPDSTRPFPLSSHRAKTPASEPPDGTSERRQASRLQVECEVSLTGENVFFAGRTEDVSATGLFVATDEPLRVGTPLLLSFVLPDGYWVRAEGEVSWVRAPRYRPEQLAAGMGIRFVAVSEKDLGAIEHFLAVRPALQL